MIQLWKVHHIISGISYWVPDAPSSLWEGYVQEYDGQKTKITMGLLETGSTLPHRVSEDELSYHI